MQQDCLWFLVDLYFLSNFNFSLQAIHWGLRQVLVVADSLCANLNFRPSTKYAGSRINTVMGEESMNDFPYERLDTIRLLRLSREKDRSIVGSLSHFSLTSPDCVPFTTLSYVWGEKRYQNSIILNGHRFWVLDSLYPVLETICDDPQLRKHWWLLAGTRPPGKTIMMQCRTTTTLLRLCYLATASLLALRTIPISPIMALFGALSRTLGLDLLDATTPMPRTAICPC